VYSLGDRCGRKEEQNRNLPNYGFCRVQGKDKKKGVFGIVNKIERAKRTRRGHRPTTDKRVEIPPPIDHVGRRNKERERGKT